MNNSQKTQRLRRAGLDHLVCMVGSLWLTVHAAVAFTTEMPTVSPADSRGSTVVFETSLGEIVVAFDAANAPKTTEYFLGYVDRGQYDGATLYRSATFDSDAAPQIVQGGVLVAALNQAGKIDPAAFGVDYLTTLETTHNTGIRHQRGVVSFARDLLDTGHVIPEIVFCLRAVPEMDAFGRDKPDSHGFPAAGHVIAGMDVVEAVTRQPLEGATTIPFLRGQILSEPVQIIRAYRMPQ